MFTPRILLRTPHSPIPAMGTRVTNAEIISKLEELDTYLCIKSRDFKYNNTDNALDTLHQRSLKPNSD